MSEQCILRDYSEARSDKDKARETAKGCRQPKNSKCVLCSASTQPPNFPLCLPCHSTILIHTSNVCPGVKPMQGEIIQYILLQNLQNWLQFYQVCNRPSRWQQHENNKTSACCLPDDQNSLFSFQSSSVPNAGAALKARGHACAWGMRCNRSLAARCLSVRLSHVSSPTSHRGNCTSVLFTTPYHTPPAPLTSGTSRNNSARLGSHTGSAAEIWGFFVSKLG